MGLVKGGALRLIQTFLYVLAFCCAGITLGIYSYFLSVLADRDAFIAKYVKAVEGISGAAVVYTIFAVVLTCCLAGVRLFSIIGLILDVLFIGGFIAMAVLTRHGAGSCRGTVNTPLGIGNSQSGASGFGNDFGFGDHGNATYSVKPYTACRLNTVCFAVSLIGALVFLLTAVMQIFLMKHHKKEKRYGPGPSNNYTSGVGKRKFWQRKPKDTAMTTRDAEMGTAAGAGGLAAPNPDMRPSYETGTTVGNNTHGIHDKVEPAGAHSGYYTQPTGTGVNPYTTTGTATNY